MYVLVYFITDNIAVTYITQITDYRDNIIIVYYARRQHHTIKYTVKD